jgi:aminoglycoside phosphotransferase family enzyme/predicted kinase
MSESAVPMIMKDLVRPEKVLETHISHVFLTEDMVYKVKKNVNFGFLDFSRLKLRKQYCLMEKELNGRFSEGIYGDVLKIARLEKSFALVPYDNTQNGVDYVVTMKRIPDGDFFSERVKKGEIDEAKAKETGDWIAGLFKGIVTDTASAEENGSYSVVRFNCEENFTQTEGFKDRFLNGRFFEFVKRKTLSFLDANEELFRKRLTDGFIINGHGDLRAEHVFFNGDRVGLIDCIEFNKRFRYNDAVSEIAFLSMELDELGRADLADALCEGFFKIYDDEGSRKLLNFYKCYRAYVRAKVTCFLLAEKGEEWENFTSVHAAAERLLELAASYALNMEEAKTLMFYGYMGCGKSKNARIFGSLFPSAVFNTDVERKKLSGLKPTDSEKVALGAGIYSHEKSLEVYEYLGFKAAEKKAVGRMTILDGTFSSPDFVEAAEKNIKFYKKIRFTAPDAVILDRFEQRARHESVSDGRTEIYFEHKEKYVDPGADFTVETTGIAENNARAVMEFFVNEE